MNLQKQLKSSFDEMIAYRESVGYATDTYCSSIPPFLAYCTEHYPEEKIITQEMVDSWLSCRNYSHNSQAIFISLLREYTRFRNFLGFQDFIPDEEYSMKRLRYNPYLFSDDELTALFQTIDSYKGDTCGKRFMPEIILPVYSRFLFCCGMRPQEPPSLKCEDVDLENGDIYIRQSKRHKDRHIIMSSDMLELCNQYDRLVGKREWFFQRWDGKPYETSWYNEAWRRIIAKTDIDWKGRPRPYDLRHAFASRNIIRWINDGKDVMELMPYLSSYMGHSELSSTFYYIHLIPEKLRRSENINWAMLEQIYGKEVCSNEN